MMSKLNFRLIGSPSSLVLAFTLLALSFTFGAVRAHAEEAVTISCPLPTDVMDATVAEELDVLCQAQAATEIAQSTADASTPSATEGQAILVEITQTVTVATLGQELAASDETDVTGAVLSESTSDDVISKPEPVALYRPE
jgi:hypothetical protein